MIYVGHSKFRWHPMCAILRAIEPIRSQFARIALVGYGWSALPPWATAMQLEDAYYSDVEYLQELNVELLEPVPFESVIDWMSKASFNPVISRPTFSVLRLVTPRFFETPAANTVPIFGLDAEYAAEIYGPDAAELVMRGDGSELFVDMIRQPAHYDQLVRGIRQHLAAHHNHTVRLRELIDIIEA